MFVCSSAAVATSARGLSTGRIIGRIIAFADPLSDDYGNSLEPHAEEDMNAVRVIHAVGPLSANITELYVSHEGAARAQFVAFLRKEPILLDGTFLSDVIVPNAVC